jgi:tripartite-type tricarboxylate transporter receptor subunit TctC
MCREILHVSDGMSFAPMALHLRFSGQALMIDLRKAACAALAIAAVLVGGTAARAQSPAYPTRTITLIVPFAAGGTSDVVARVLAERMSADLGQSVIVENRSGGNGIIGAQAAARSRPDGYTVVQVSTTHVILPSLRQDIPYDWKRDLTPVFGVLGVPQTIAVNGKSSIRSMTDLVATANAMPTGINYASGGTGTLGHLTSALVVQALKVRAVHVPYRGLAPAGQAVLGEQAQFATLNIPEVLELAKSGALRLLAVTSEQRLPDLPDVPTLKELGFAEPVSVSWTANLVPANTPADIVERLHNAFAKAVSEPGTKERLSKMGVVVNAMKGAELGRFMNDEATRWRRVIEENQIKLEN